MSFFEKEQQISDEPPAKRVPDDPRNVNVPRILDGKYYVVTKRDNFKITAVCTNCDAQRKGDTRSTGNFMEHYKTHHPSMVQEVNTHRKRKDCTTKKLRQTTLNKSISLSTQVVSFF